MKKTVSLITAFCLILVLFCSCGETQEAPDTTSPEPLPAPEIQEGSMFGVDKNINMTTIDEFLGREDVAYRDMRMLFDPADYASIGGEADLTRTITGYKIVPFPYIATLQTLPVEGAYQGKNLYSVEWNSDGTVKSAEAMYRESEMILSELFPKDKSIFLMCGGGGYANMMKQLLIFLGWDENLLYNTGANWEYDGDNKLELVVYPETAGERNIYATWRADYAYIDFDKLCPLED